MVCEVWIIVSHHLSYYAHQDYEELAGAGFPREEHSGHPRRSAEHPINHDRPVISKPSLDDRDLQLLMFGKVFKYLPACSKNANTSLS